jgi:hypothetical protein
VYGEIGKMIHTLTMVVFLFTGDSRMAGYCSTMDTTTNSHVYSWSPSKGFYNCTDKNNKNSFITQSGSMVMPFLKGMALRYPEYNFCGIEYGHPCGQAHHVYEEQQHRSFWESRVSAMTALKDSGVVLGGVVIMYGLVEAGEMTEIKNYPASMSRLVSFFREKTGNPLLPAIFPRWPLYSSPNESDNKYHKYDSLMNASDESLLMNISNSVHTPVRYLGKQFYCNMDHHETQAGYTILAQDAITMYQLFNFDFWKK